MRTLILLRHAKSAWASPGMDDFDRPLNERGHKTAQEMATWLMQQQWIPDVVLCSPAARTRGTLDHVKKLMTLNATTIIEPDLYLASSERLIRYVAKVENRFHTALLIAHNPGIHDAALDLLHANSRHQSGELRARFPTSACAVITFDLDHWCDIEINKGQLKGFMHPKLLISDKER